MAWDASESIKREDVEAALERALTAESIANSTQLANFLTFVVAKKLDGEEEDIKAYSIAVDALGRGDDFDPQESAAVRVAAGRLRQALALHNAQLEDDAAVRIILEPGSYVPSFQAGETLALETRVREETQEPGSENIQEAPSLFATEMAKPKATIPRWLYIVIGILSLLALTNFGLYLSNSRLASEPQQTVELEPQDVGRLPQISATLILPDKDYPQWFRTGEFGDSVGLVMARFNDYQFMGLSRPENEQVPTKLMGDFHMLVTARKRGDQVRFFGSLKRVKDGAVIWSVSRLLSRPEKIEERNVVDLLGRIYSPVGSPYGVIYVDLLNSNDIRSELDCVIKGYQYFYSQTDKSHMEARACAEEAVVRKTKLPSVYAMLTFLYLDEYREGRNRRERDPLTAAFRMAEKAVSLGPQSARAHQASFAVHKVQGHRDLAYKSALKAIELNPYDADIMADYSAWLISIGDIEQGRKLLARADALLSARPAWFEFYRFLGAELAEDFSSSNDITKLMDMRRSPLLAIAVAIGAHSRGDFKKSEAALRELVRVEPGFADNPVNEFLKRGFDREVSEKLSEKLHNAGLSQLTK